MSKYKHVSQHYHSDRAGMLWRARLRGEFLGSFADEELAAQAVAKKLRQPKASLLRLTAPAAPPKCKYKHVTQRHRLGLPWQAQVDGEYFGLLPRSGACRASCGQEASAT